MAGIAEAESLGVSRETATTGRLCPAMTVEKQRIELRRDVCGWSLD
jgi:hypothetical protein